MAESTGCAVVPHDTSLVQAGNREFNAATVTELLHHAIKSLVDFACPPSIRTEYRLVFSELSKNRFDCIFLGILLIFSVAEYEQPGWFPRPDQLSSAVIGFLGACTLILPAIALFEYDETHSWPWEDEGFVWPWEALLWSTLYNDEIFDKSTLAYIHLHDVLASSSQRAHVDVPVGEHGQSLNVASGGTKSFSIPETPERQDMFIPPTPFLPRGLRPAYLFSPIKHGSGLLGPSPIPAQSDRTNGKLV